MGSLFPGLPDEIGWECLLRVELNSHHNLKCVCKSWNAALKNPHFYEERKRLKISEQRICMLDDRRGIVVYDVEEKSYRRLPPIPTEITNSYHCHFAKQKLVIISDYEFSDRDRCISNSVWLFDFTCSKWRRGTETPRPILGFASAADEQGGLIYVAGGHCIFAKDVRRCTSVYNVEEDKWDFLPDMNAYMPSYSAVFSDGKFYVYSGGEIEPTFEVFDPYTRSWKSVENRFNSACFLSAFGRLYCLSDPEYEYTQPRELIEYEYSQDKFHIVGAHSMEWWEPLIFTVEVGHNIFVGSMDYDFVQTFLTFTPPSETGGAFKRIGIDRLSGLSSFVLHAATLDL
ncbi:hypothetical protein SUGI_0129970 [Cryptomeria japonica]|uniref:F-box/kelch-repeat protein At5g60570-like n=1 Tax=Cryptomeria japonica TaxID=3369 RepID=UPI0024089604|nr:F-box/kelch-repeat protein At5g60570-like [Cryptomeria japonica]GLJ10535.1 hypothetical protein SUGI_0129970 [Cryptomeria japonica]